MLLNKKEQSFFIVVNDCSYYVEKGHVYCFQPHKNNQVLEYITAWHTKEVSEKEFKKLMTELILQQIYYDWFIDIEKEKFIVMCEEFGDEFDVFFCE